MNFRREALLAASNNVDWYDAIFRSLGLSGTVQDGVWTSRDQAPPHHSNAVILVPAAGDEHRQIIQRLAQDLGRPFSFKDSFATHDFAPDGFRPLFDAEWIWRDADLPRPQPDARKAEWRQVETADELAVEPQQVVLGESEAADGRLRF